MRVVLSPLAEVDLDDAYRHIEGGSPRSADRFLLHFTETLGLLSSGLHIGRRVRLRDGRSVWSWPMPPYRLYYRMTAQELQVIRLYHQARRPIERKSR